MCNRWRRLADADISIYAWKIFTHTRTTKRAKKQSSRLSSRVTPVSLRQRDRMRRGWTLTFATCLDPASMPNWSYLPLFPLVIQLLSDKRNARMRFVRYFICCNAVFWMLGHISRRRRGVQVCIMVVRIRLLPFWWRYLQRSPNTGSNRASCGPFWPLNFCHLTANISKTVCRSVTVISHCRIVPVPWQKWMAAYLGYTLQMNTLCGWPVIWEEVISISLTSVWQ